MASNQIQIKTTSDDSILKFEVGKFLSRHNSYKYFHVAETQNSPLAQQLFQLPFVTAVYIAQNFIGVRKHSTVEWKDVQDEVAVQIRGYMDSGKQVLSESEKPKGNLPITVYAQSEFNSGLMKFVANKKLVVKPMEFKNREVVENAPLVERLFLFPYVDKVFLEENVVSITKDNSVGWEEITLELREFIRSYLKSGGVVVSEE